jgi:putative flippase GtrA
MSRKTYMDTATMGGETAENPTVLSSNDRLLARAIAWLPRPVRFLGVGGLGLTTDFCIFTALMLGGVPPLVGRALSIVLATCVTWRLNRAVTFARSHRRQSEEAARYGMVTAAAQGTSYAVFTVLILMGPAWPPQVALLIGAATGALISYNGHRLVSFAPRAEALPSQ